MAVGRALSAGGWVTTVGRVKTKHTIPVACLPEGSAAPAPWDRGMAPAAGGPGGGEGGGGGTPAATAPPLVRWCRLVTRQPDHRSGTAWDTARRIGGGVGGV